MTQNVLDSIPTLPYSHPSHWRRWSGRRVRCRALRLKCARGQFTKPGSYVFIYVYTMVGATQHPFSCTGTHGRCYATSSCMCYFQSECNIHVFVCIKKELRMTHMLGKRKPFNPYIPRSGYSVFFSELFWRSWKWTRRRTGTSFNPQLMHRLRCSGICVFLFVSYMYVYIDIYIYIYIYIYLNVMKAKVYVQI